MFIPKTSPFKLSPIPKMSSGSSGGARILESNKANDDRESGRNLGLKIKINAVD